MAQLLAECKQKKSTSLKAKHHKNCFLLFVISLPQTLDLELGDLETEVKRALVTAEQMLTHRQDNVPPQLLLALEKDKESLARGHEAARALSADILQSLKNHKESRKVRRTINS